MNKVKRIQPLVGTAIIIDEALILPADIIEELNWDERILLELEFVNDRWILKQSKVAATKFPGHKISDELQRSK